MLTIQVEQVSEHTCIRNAAGVEGAALRFAPNLHQGKEERVASQSTLRFADDVPLFSTSMEKLRSMMCGQDQNSQRSGIEQKKRGVDRQHQSQGITSERMCQVSRRNNNVRATRNNRNQESTPRSLGIIYQVQTGANIEIVPSTKQTSLIQHGHHSYADIRL